jgi:RNA polymerase sigma-70 factor (ECF subfamily)
MDDDDQLMLRLQGGDRSAFDELVSRHQGRLWGFFVRNTRDPQLAEDLTQETLLKVYDQFWDYLPSGRFSGWIFRIARNLLIDDVRRRSHDALLCALRSRGGHPDDRLDRLAGKLGPGPEEEAAQREFSAQLQGLLDEIPAEQRLTFCMHHFDGLSLPDIADALDIPLATCKSRLRLARAKLAQKLQSRGRPELLRLTKGQPP